MSVGPDLPVPPPPGEAGPGTLGIELEGGRAIFAPRETLQGALVWDLPEVPEMLSVRLFWYTQGKGDQDVGIVASEDFTPSGAQGRASFRFTLPDGPYSFSGELISILWALEVVVEPGERAARVDLLLSPSGQEVRVEASHTDSTG